MTETTHQHASLMDLTVAIVPRVRIEDIRLVNATVRSQLDQISGPLTASFGFDAITSIDQERKKLVVRASLMVSGKGASSSDAAVDEQLHIETEFVLIYAIESFEGITGESAKAFGRLNGIHNVWPYWREYVQSTTVRLGLPPLTLPPITGGSLVEYYASRETAQREGASDANTVVAPS